MSSPLPPLTPSKLLASRFAHLAYSPSKTKNAKASSSRPPPSPPTKKKKRVSSDVDSSDLDASEEEKPVEQGQDQEIKIEAGEEEEVGILSAPKPESEERKESSPYFPSSSQLKRKLSTSSSSSSLPPTISTLLPSPTKKNKPPGSSQAPPRPYAPSTQYERDHPPLTDLMCFDADVMFCGINPGLSSAKRGHHYAGPTNRFWNCLYQSGFTPTLLAPSQDHLLPLEHNISMTNLVSRPTAAASELSPHLDLRPSVPSLLSKINTYRPRVVCFVGKDIWREVEFVLKKSSISGSGSGSSPTKKTKGKEKAREVGASEKEREWEGPRGWKFVHSTQEDEGEEREEKGNGRVRETFFWVVSSTSGLVRDSMPHRLSTQWSPLLAFLADLKAGVQPWLVPHEREFLVVPDEEVVERVAEELKERYLREREGRGKGKREEGDGIGEARGGEEEEESGRRSGWRVVEVLVPGGGEEG